jgi:hypothetical protein
MVTYRDDLGIFGEYNMVFHQLLAGNSDWEIIGLPSGNFIEHDCYGKLTMKVDLHIKHDDVLQHTVALPEGTCFISN